ncbi:GNAT family N-acetyltransferase [Muricauda sp. CAU 1633]|uniref:GNAT family N-acetyltransferase n=1 Tax=Allomuricauda sp. CAU 1633 TaxID=2816036 RepID=UPI001A8EBDF0|nr:GNAT family N-acetyltransferase [Muricauda sp. CAU 1633]MBO0322241.1 GNAT family N-acetyltransferase [Muricauda sp. CAU 1633]
MDLIEANINNLTGLWRIAGRLAGQYMEGPDFSLSIAGSGDWPNKLWFSRPVDQQIVAGIPHRHLDKLAIPIWGNDLSTQELMLKNQGFFVKSEQVAMSIKLDETPAHLGRLVARKVTNERMALTWSQLFQEAFGYSISADTVIKTMWDIAYFIGADEEVPVGTAVLFMDEYGIAGIHSMGVVPSQRRKGYARDLLVHLLNIARIKGAAHATLQASQMGKGVYLQTGFQEDFNIKTFIKHKN